MSLLAGYYSAIDEEKQASAQNLIAQAGLTRANASEVAPDAQARQAALQGQANSSNAGAGRTVAETAQVAPNAASQRALQGAQTGLVGTQAGVLPNVSASEIGLRGAQTDAAGVGADVTRLNLPADQGYEKGGKVVSQKQAAKGKGGKPGPTDTVSAALTPGEIVLNKGAVEHYGSDVIAHMNRMGLMRMAAQSETAAHAGMVDPHAGLPGFGASHGAGQQGSTGYGLKVVDDAAKGKAAPKAKSKAA